MLLGTSLSLFMCRLGWLEQPYQRTVSASVALSAHQSATLDRCQPATIAAVVVAVVVAREVVRRCRDHDGVPLLHRALASDRLSPSVKRLVLEVAVAVGGVQVTEATTPLGLSPLHVAASKGLASICARLVILGAQHAVLDKRQCTALMYAVQSASVDEVAALATAETLLALGADASAADGAQRTPVYHAARLGRPAVLAALLDVQDATAHKTAVVGRRDRAGYTALHAATLAVADPDVAAQCIALLLATRTATFIPQKTPKTTTWA